jgi:hypothetical protein
MVGISTARQRKAHNPEEIEGLLTYEVGRCNTALHWRGAAERRFGYVQAANRPVLFPGQPEFRLELAGPELLQ